jgi:hypothetical protein
MNRNYADSHYASTYVQDNAGGFAGLELLRTRNGEQQCVARVLYWDACGQFYFETLGVDIPVDIVEELINEAKERISFR